MLSDIELMELLCARFSHDLAGPIGAICNGLDLLEDESSTMKQDALKLVTLCANQAVSRIKLFRQLYGTTLAVGEADLNEMKSLIENFFAGTKYHLDWPNESLFITFYSINHREAKLILVMIIASSSMLVNGGKISVKLLPISNGCQLIINISGSHIKIEDIALEMLKHDVDHSLINTKNIQFYLIKRFADLLNTEVRVENDKEQLNFIANIKN